MRTMSENRNSYGNILKSISLFGGVQVFQIIIGLVKNKIVALLLGPAGMGIMGMITSATSMVETLTGFGLRTSGTRSIASSVSSNNADTIGRVLSVIRHLVIYTGLLGSAVIFILAKQLSIWSFGNEDYVVAFRIVSCVAFLNQLNVGQTTLMQGTFHYKLMAKSALWGSIWGLVISVPLYYLWGTSAIVPVIIVSSFANLLLSTFYSRKVPYKKIRLSSSEIWCEGKGILGLGLAIALTGAVTLGQTYIIRAFISRSGGLTEVGLYSAGIALTSMYVNTLLNAIGSDYSPRLASMSNDNSLFIETINRQINLMVAMIVPMIVLFVVIIREITILLYSEKFLPIASMVEWMMLGMFFRTCSWCLSYAQVARGDSKVFFWNELACSIYSVLFAVIGYHYLGFDGIGIAFVLQYVIYTVQMYFLSANRFNYSLSKETKLIVIQGLLILIITFIIMRVLNYSFLRYLIGSILVVGTLCFAYYRINKMLPLKGIIIGHINKLKRR